MKLPQLLSLLVIVCVATTGCQKEMEEGVINPPVGPPVFTGDSIYLDKIYQQKKNAGIFDTVYIMSFFYDGQKRLSSAKDSSVTAGEEYYLYTFFYNGADTVPYKTIEKNFHLTDTTLIEIFKYYDAQSRISSDSMVISSSNDHYFIKDILTGIYNYTANSVVAQRKFVYTGSPAQISYAKDTSILDNAGNEISNKSYTSATAGGSFHLSASSLFSYDGKVSPAAKWRYHFSQNLLSVEDHPIIGARNNNRTSATTRRYSGNGTLQTEENVSFIYNYNINGLPSIVSWESGTPDEVRNSFTYRAF